MNEFSHESSEDKRVIPRNAGPNGRHYKLDEDGKLYLPEENGQAIAVEAEAQPETAEQESKPDVASTQVFTHDGVQQLLGTEC